MTWEAIFLNDFHICPTNISQKMQLDYRQNRPRQKPGSSSITTTETNSREGSKPWAVNNPLASFCLLGRSMGVSQTPGLRSFLWQLEMTTHSSTLTWKIPWMEQPDRLQSMGSQRVGHDWATSHSFVHSFMIDSVSGGQTGCHYGRWRGKHDADILPKFCKWDHALECTGDCW